MNRNNIFTTIASKDTRKGTTNCSGPRVIPPIASTSNGQSRTAPPKRKTSDSSLSSNDSIDLTFHCYGREWSSCSSLILSADYQYFQRRSEWLETQLRKHTGNALEPSYQITKGLTSYIYDRIAKLD